MVKDSPANAGNTSLIPGLEDSLEEAVLSACLPRKSHGHTVHGVVKSNIPEHAQEKLSYVLKHTCGYHLES